MAHIQTRAQTKVRVQMGPQRRVRIQAQIRSRLHGSHGQPYEYVTVWGACTLRPGTLTAAPAPAVVRAVMVLVGVVVAVAGA